VGVISRRERESRTGLPGPRASNTASAIGVSLVVTSAVLSSSLVLSTLGIATAGAPPRLWIGAALFRLGLAALGFFLVAAGRLPIWNGRTRPTPPAESRPRWAGAALVAILVVALALRLHHLDAGLWYDEINAYVLFMGMPFGEILTTYESESQHLLFTLLARLAFTLFGEGPASLRLPAALFGVGSVAALYLLARRVATRGEALLAAALLSVSYHHLWFSQNARGYTALLFWTLLSSWLFLRALDEGQSRLWLGYAGAVALGMFTHVTMLFAVLAHAAVYGIRRARPGAARDPAAWGGPVLGFGLAALLTFQLYALVLPQFLSTIGTKANVAEWTNPLWTLLELARGLRVGFAGSAVATAALVVFGVGLLSFARTAPVIVVFLLLPAAVATMAVMAMGHPLWPRFFFFLMGFGVLIAVRGGMVVGGWGARALGLPAGRAASAGMAVGLLLILASAATVPTAWLPKQDYVGARGFIESHKQPGDAIVTVGLATYPYRAFYRTGWEAAESVDALNAIRAQAKRTWIVYTIPMQLEGRSPELMAAIRRDFTLIRKFSGTLNGGSIYVWRAEGDPAAAGTTARRS
jgi:mannosyltransferase